MAFWSGETLAERLTELVDDPDKGCIDCAAYTLKVGSEYYVTPTDETPNPKSSTLKKLGPCEAFAIPPGQFAWILTHEIVTVPTGVLAFISMRARFKWKGLINVSGFHVDPGYVGRLTFSVFNAGPTPIHLRQGDPTFLIWFADLDRGRSTFAKSAKTPVTQVNLDALNQMAGEVHSLQGLADRIRTTEKELSVRITSLERSNGVISVIAGIVITLAVGLSVQWISRQYASSIPAGGSQSPAEAPVRPTTHIPKE